MNDRTILREADLDGLLQIELRPEAPLSDCRAAMALVNAEADSRPGEHMLLSWYDRDRNFEPPQPAGECQADSAVPGYVDDGIHHGASLNIDIERGRFLFFCPPIDLATF